MAFVALRRMLIGDRHREAGEAVPEAAGWRNLRSYIGSGHIKEVPDAESPTPPPTPAGAPKRTASRQTPADDFKVDLPPRP